MKETTLKLLEIADLIPGYNREELINDLHPDDPDKMMTVKDVASMLRCSVWGVRKWVKEGRLTPVTGGGQSGRTILFKRQEVLRAIQGDKKCQ